MDIHPKIALKLSFPNEAVAKVFVQHCLDNLNSVYSLNRNNIFITLQSQDERAAALLEARKLTGRLLVDDD